MDPPEYTFDATRIAALAPAFSIPRRSRASTTSCCSPPRSATRPSRSVCAHALVEPDLLVIPDLRLDARTCDTPLVTDAPFIRFYAGAPLRTAAGEVLGSLCVIDGDPRPQGITDLQASCLRSLAR